MADACAFLEELRSVYAVIVDEAGAEVTSPSLDELRSTMQTLFALSLALQLGRAGLRSQAATILRSLGIHESQSACTKRYEELWIANPAIAYIPAEHRASIMKFGTLGFTAAQFCPQSDAAVQSVRAVLDGTASDGPSGVDALAAAQGSCRDTYVTTVCYGVLTKACGIMQWLHAHAPAVVQQLPFRTPHAC